MQEFLVINESTEKLPYYLIGVGIEYEQMPKDRKVGVPFYNWIQCVEGAGIFKIGKEEVRIEEGQGIMILPNIPVSYWPITSSWIVDWISFSGKGVNHLLGAWDISTCGIYNIVDSHHLQDKIRQLYGLVVKGSEDYIISETLYSILLNLCRQINIVPQFNQLKNKLYPVIEYIHKNISEPMILEDMAETIQITPEHLCYLFKQVLGKRPMTYVNEYRIAKAKSILLSEDREKIDEIARKLGFNNASYFAKVFKNIEGITPSKYRELYG